MEISLNFNLESDPFLAAAEERPLQCTSVRFLSADEQKCYRHGDPSAAEFP